MSVFYLWTKSVAAAGRRARSAELCCPALEYLELQDRTPWEIVWMSGVYQDVSFEGPAQLAANQTAQQRWWQWFRLNSEEWEMRMKSLLRGVCCWLCQSNVPLLQKTFLLGEICWAWWCRSLMQHLEKLENQELSPFCRGRVPAANPAQIKGRFVPKSCGCRWTYTSNCSCFHSNYSSVWLGFSSNPSFPLKQTPEHQSCNPSGDIY